MTRRFNSFLLRFWDRTDGTIRIEIEHIQDGAHVVVDSAAVALSWINARAIEDARARGPDPVRNGPADDSESPL